jgi:hypothetical protein
MIVGLLWRSSLILAYRRSSIYYENCIIRQLGAIHLFNTEMHRNNAYKFLIIKTKCGAHENAFKKLPTNFIQMCT